MPAGAHDIVMRRNGLYVPQWHTITVTSSMPSVQVSSLIWSLHFMKQKCRTLSDLWQRGYCGLCIGECTIKIQAIIDWFV